ncbi:MAG: dihydroorotate dehydrogenase electron transfer subunit [Lachnospiraceae bacterium]|nr:dihydroorotate dehydrogenase electron transfer subunit [Lachnospiraceae bacterium]
MKKQKVTAVIRRQEEIAEDIYDLWLETELAGSAKPGQFVGVYPPDGAKLLPRPISICKADPEGGLLRLVYRVAGGGTAEFSQMHAGQKLKILGVLGNGFPIEKADGKSIFVMGGGIGIPPMLQTVISLQQRGEAKNINAVLGYRSERFLMEEFTQHCLAYAATEDGSYGTKGNVMDLVREHDLKGDMIFACGPMPMLRAVKEFAQANNIEAYISLEERMACGVGACLGCVCKTKETDAHSKVHNARICTDGPVFEAGSVDI